MIQYLCIFIFFCLLHFFFLFYKNNLIKVVGIQVSLDLKKESVDLHKSVPIKTNNNKQTTLPPL